jgi:S1-C subfamily serine protease
MFARRPNRVLIAAAALAAGLGAARAEPPEPPPAPPAPTPWGGALPDDPGAQAAYLGVRLREETGHAEGGARITDVVEDSPAAAAGLEPGDIIVRFGGETVRGPVALSEKLRAKSPGDTVPITVLRAGAERTIEVRLSSRLEQLGVLVYPLGREGVEPPERYWDAEGWERQHRELQERLRQLGERLEHQAPPAPHAPGAPPPLDPGTLELYWESDRPRLGVQLVETTPELRVHLGADGEAGVLVSKVLTGTPAERAGVRVGDLIVAVDGRRVASAAELVAALADKAGRTFPLEVVRGRERRTIEVTLPDLDAERPTGPRA